ncbi:MAG: MBL fold metallo-hydrolase [bacterium]
MPADVRFAQWTLAVCLTAASASLVEGCSIPDAPAAMVEEEPDARTLYASHRRGATFFNPWAEMTTGFTDLLRWKLSRNEFSEAKRRTPDVPRVANDGSTLLADLEDPSVTWIGHATALVEDEGDVWLTDPIFSDSIFGLRERLHPPGIPLERIPPPRFVVVSHNHYDHLDAPTIEALPGSTVMVVPLGLGDWMRDAGREQVTELDWWQSTLVGDWTITCLPSQHWSLRTLDRNETLWASWLVEGHGRRYYFAGDTGYFPGFAEYGRRFGPIDVALLPIGAYAPRWFMAYQHMDPAQALTAFAELGARWMVPIHWGTFDLSDEPMDEPPRELARVAASRPELGERIKVLAIGETFHLPSG